MKLNWNYDNSLLSVSAAVHKFCGLSYDYRPDDKIYNWLSEGGFNQLFVVLIDGMGTKILHEHLDDDSLFLSNVISEVNSVFPPTTAAATTSFLTCKSPRQTGWLAWDQYFKEVDDVVMTFVGRGMFSFIDHGSDFGFNTLPVEYIFEKMGDRAKAFYPFWGKYNPVNGFKELMDNMVETSKDDSIKFAYFYDDAVDTLMHKQGPEYKGVEKLIAKRQRRLLLALDKMPKTTAVLVLADHGQIKANPLSIDKDEKFRSYLVGDPALDSRIWSVRIKKGKKEEFESYVNDKYLDVLDIYDSNDVAKSSLFGPVGMGDHDRFEEFLGDFILICKDNYNFTWDGLGVLKGVHSGPCDAEAKISVMGFTGQK